jgi:hypothetical protein
MAEWTYARRARQGNGELLRDGAVMGIGYSGHGEGLNNPAADAETGVGPVPAGRYAIGPFFDHPHLGPCVARLVPLAGTDTHGRSGFFIHGDNAAANHTASDGCIILARPLREMIRASGTHLVLTVT